MFYEEQVIGGVLHSRSSPSGVFYPLSKLQLTQRLLAARAELDELQTQVEIATNPRPSDAPFGELDDEFAHRLGF